MEIVRRRKPNIAPDASSLSLASGVPDVKRSEAITSFRDHSITAAQRWTSLWQALG